MKKYTKLGRESARKQGQTKLDSLFGGAKEGKDMTENNRKA
jgi:hypothetical protein